LRDSSESKKPPSNLPHRLAAGGVFAVAPLRGAFALFVGAVSLPAATVRSPPQAGRISAMPSNMQTVAAGQKRI